MSPVSKRPEDRGWWASELTTRREGYEAVIRPTAHYEACPWSWLVRERSPDPSSVAQPRAFMSGQVSCQGYAVEAAEKALDALCVEDPTVPPWRDS